MPKQAMTVKWVETVKGGAERVEYSDTNTSGLYLVVQPSGKKSWAFRGKHPQTGKSVKHTHPGGFVHYAKAKEWAAEHLAAREVKTDLVDEQRKAKAAEEALSVRTLDWFWTNHYRPAFVDRLADHRETCRMWDRLISPRVGKLPLGKVDHEALSEVIETIHAHAPITANRVVTMLRTMFKRALSGNLRTVSGLKSNPAEYLTKPAVEVAREHTLNRDELGVVLAVLDRRERTNKADSASRYAQGLKLVIATGCRRGEAFEARWDQIDLTEGTWNQPAGETKNGQPNLLKLPTATVEWLKGLRASATGDYVFPAISDAEKPFSGFSKAHAAVEADTVRVGEGLGITVRPWTAHDLRRTFSTETRGIRQPGSLLPMIPDAVIEAVLNHVEGAGKKGVAKVYNRYRYFGEKAEALAIWRDWLDAVAKDHEARKLAA